jgi:20S proteasome alpha/beta subunit
MTLVIGIVCKDGVVVACDSQVEIGAFKKFVRKMWGLDKNIVIAGSGSAIFQKKAIELLRGSMIEKEKKGKREFSMKEVVRLAERVMLNLHKTYDIDRAKFLEEEAEKPTKRRIIQVSLVMGGVEKGEKYLYVLYPDGVAEPYDNYCAEGSGTPFAEYLLSKLYDPKITLGIAKKLAIYIIEEAKKVDAYVGGPVNVVAIKEGRLETMSQNQIMKAYEEIQETNKKLDLLKAKYFYGEITADKLKEIITLT